MLGIFGGSFDPIHFGHIKLALALLEHFDFEQIRFIPCQQSPHKQAVHANAQHRWQMLELVTNAYTKLIADDRELKRSGLSYTIDTLKELRAETKSRQTLVLIIGIDAFLNFCKWRQFEEILLICHMMLLPRSGYGLPQEGCEKELYDTHGTDDIMDLSGALNGFIYLSDAKEIDVSSTAIRECISADAQPRYLLPGNVWNYIRRNNLYT